MGKFLVRISVLLVAIYFIFAFYTTYTTGIDNFHNNYILLFEAIVVVYCYSEGKYHCKYMKYTALSILISDTLTRLDYLYDFMSVSLHNLIPVTIICFGLGFSVVKALIHFYKVMSLKWKKTNSVR